VCSSDLTRPTPPGADGFVERRDGLDGGAGSESETDDDGDQKDSGSSAGSRRQDFDQVRHKELFSTDLQERNQQVRQSVPLDQRLPG